MIRFLKENVQFLLLLTVWTVAGILVRETALLLVPLGLVIFKYKRRYTEMVLAFVFIIYVSDNRHHELDFAKDVKDIALVILSAFFILNDNEFKEKSKLYMPFALFLLLAFPLSLRHPDPVLSFQKTLSYALLLFCIPNYFIRQIKEEGEQFMRNVVWFCVILLFAGFVMMALLEGSWTYLNGRYNGSLGNPNGIGTFCLLTTILISLARYHYPGIFEKREMFFMYTVITISVILSGSRNGMFSILIFLFFLHFYRISYYFGFMIVIASAVIFQLINENIADIVNALGLGEFLRVEQLNDGSGRLVAWGFAWQEIQKHFLLGLGFAYEEYLFDFNEWWLSALNHQGGVHNTYLAVWLNTGLIGLILFMIGLIRSFIVKAYRNYLTLPAMFAILFAITFEPWFQSSLNPFTTLALLIITLLQYEQPLGEAKEDPDPVL